MAEVVNKFHQRDMSEIFKKCGYIGHGKFDPSCMSPETLKDIGFDDQCAESKKIL